MPRYLNLRQPIPTQEQAEGFGRALLRGEAPQWRQGREFFRRIPSSPRCKLCASPFKGPGGVLMRAIGKPPWPKNPQYCAACFRVVTRMHAGAEVECSLMFADVRGSTTIAEGMRAAAFRGLMAGFFRTATQVLVDHDAIVDKFVGDEVVALFIPALTGAAHAERAIATAQALIAAMSGRQDGKSLPIGAGVHTGVAFVGSVGDGDASDFTAMRDPVNVAARLASAAGAGEILVTLDAARAASLSLDGLEHRSLALKGKTNQTEVVVIRAAT